MNSSFHEALGVLRSGGIILYPTDTIWGLGCDATDPAAVERIFRIKNRPDSKSLVLLASDLDMVTRYVRAIPEIALDLIEVNDRPMTIIYPDAVVAPAPAVMPAAGHTAVMSSAPSVIPSAPSVIPSECERISSATFASVVTAPASPVMPGGDRASRPDRRFLARNAVAEDGSVGIRIPLMAELCDMIRHLGRPVVSTSANVSGEPSPKRFADIPEAIRAAVDYVVDPALEASSTGLASQIIKLSLSGEVQILRP